MLGFLFRGLTADRQGGAMLFDALTREARLKHWYVKGEVPDTLDGRFAVLAMVTALTIVRLERDGAEGDRVSVLLTERFIEVMESEHRELGLGDPTLGKTVRKLVGLLAKRTDRWRAVDDSGRIEATRESLYKAEGSPAAVEHSAAALKAFAARLESLSLGNLEQGNLG